MELCSGISASHYFYLLHARRSFLRAIFYPIFIFLIDFCHFSSSNSLFFPFSLCFYYFLSTVKNFSCLFIYLSFIRADSSYSVRMFSVVAKSFHTFWQNRLIFLKFVLHFEIMLVCSVLPTPHRFRTSGFPVFQCL